MSPRVYLSTYPYPATPEEETPVSMRIQLSHATVKALQSSLDDSVDFPVRPTHTSIDRNGHLESHFPHGCTSSGCQLGAGFWTASSKYEHPH